MTHKVYLFRPSPPRAMQLLLALLFCGSLASAQTLPVGVVKSASGASAVGPDGRERPLKPGDAIQLGDRVRTAAGGSAAVTLRDDTRIAMAPNSAIRVKGFDYDANKQQGGMTLSVLKGASAFVTGVLAKAAPDAVKVETPTTTAGIRGTEFIVEVEGGSDD